MPSFTEGFRSLDSFAKTNEEFRTKTIVGGILTIMCALGTIAFVTVEYKNLRSVSWKPEILVDTNRKSKMSINIDVSFPKVPCFALTLDVMDGADQYQNNLSKNISKKILGSDGALLEEYLEEDLQRPPDYCGSCYEASLVGPDGKPVCCNSCSAVFAAYEHQNKKLPKMEKIQQCIDEKWADRISNHSNEGCRVRGSFQVNKVAGNFHFAPGKSYDAYNLHLHDVRLLDGLDLDFNHEIHHLSFGDKHEEIHNPLDSTMSSGDADNSFKYFIKVVAAEFRYHSGLVIHSNQYAVTQHSFANSVGKIAFPSVFFHYDISPMIVVYSEYSKSWTSFITGICAVIGGIYTFASIIDSVIFNTERKVFRKVSVGKAY